MTHQQKCHEILQDREYYALFLEQGLGKTKISIDDAYRLYEQGKITRVLVIAPNGVHANWAYEELPKHAWRIPHTLVWTSSVTQRFKKLFASLCAKDDLAWLFVNVEACRSKKATDFILKFTQSGQTMMIVDESTVIKNPAAQQTKAVLDIAKLSTYRRILNGTPITQSPLDLWAQCKFLSPEALPYKSWTAFKSAFAISILTQLPNRPAPFQKITGYKNLDILSENLKGFSTRLTKEDCLDLPEKIFRRQVCEMTTEQTRIYTDIRDKAVAQIQESEELDGKVSVPTVLASLMKLQQVVSGFLIDDSGKPHAIENNRIPILLQLMGDYPEKTVVWSNFKYPIALMKRAMQKKYQCEILEYHGQIDAKKRTEAVKLFQESPHHNILLCSYAASRGLTLHASANVIYYSNSYSLYHRLQSEDRTHRIGQARKCLYTDLYTPNTVDGLIVQTLAKKKDLADAVIASNWRELLIESHAS